MPRPNRESFRSGFARRTAGGELVYSSPRATETHDEAAVLESRPCFESGRATRNWKLHEIDFDDQVEQIWGSRWGAESIGPLGEVLVSRPTANETRDRLVSGLLLLSAGSRERSGRGRFLPDGGGGERRPFRMSRRDVPTRFDRSYGTGGSGVCTESS